MKHFPLIQAIITGVLGVLLVLQCALVLLPSLWGKECFAVANGSMEPLLPVGSLIVTEPVSFEQIAPGDVLTFQEGFPPNTFTHRVTEVNAEKQWLYTKGDANQWDDPVPTTYDAVKGRVIAILPFVGYIHLFVSSEWGRILLLSIAFVWILLEFVVVWIRKRKQKFHQNQATERAVR